MRAMSAWLCPKVYMCVCMCMCVCLVMVAPKQHMRKEQGSAVLKPSHGAPQPEQGVPAAHVVNLISSSVGRQEAIFSGTSIEGFERVLDKWVLGIWSKAVIGRAKVELS